MPATTIGQRVWWLTWDDKRGPFPAVALTASEAPLLAVDMPEGPARASCSHWLVEDGTVSGWLEIPADGQPPADLFE